MTTYYPPEPVVGLAKLSDLPAAERVSAAYFNAKKDQGKLLAGIPFEDFPLAMQELIRVSTFGAQKYSRSSWKSVPDREVRYYDARARHFLGLNPDGSITENDIETGYDHLAHEIWNCMALLQLKLEKRQFNQLANY